MKCEIGGCNNKARYIVFTFKPLMDVTHEGEDIEWVDMVNWGTAGALRSYSYFVCRKCLDTLRRTGIILEIYKIEKKKKGKEK